MNIVVVGAGYVGLVSGACFAEKGHFVICIDIDVEKIENLSQGRLPIYEPGLEEMVRRNMREGRIQFTSDYKAAISTANACFIAVPTPSNADGSCNISYVKTAAGQIAEHMTDYLVVVNKSTVPVGTADRVKAIMQKKQPNVPFDVVSNPEFLKEGAAIQDCLFPDRIIIGSESERATAILQEIYRPFLDKILIMDLLSAEMTKYAANAMLATRISFMNEMAGICKKIGANINHVRQGIGADVRIGAHFLYAGVGYGGSCFPKDIRALIATAIQAGCDPKLLQAVDDVNTQQKKLLIEEMRTYFSSRGGMHTKTIAIWGLSFKPETDDMRDAPSLIMIEHLLQCGAILRLYDPVAIPNAKKIMGEHPHITWCTSVDETVRGADAIALLTEWKQFQQISLKELVPYMKQPVFFDGRNLYQSSVMQQLGFDYIPIGMPNVIH